MILIHYLKFLKFILLHKYYVLIECWKRGLYLRGIMHDMSKFRPSEFIGFSGNFIVPDESMKHQSISTRHSNFEKSWLLHQNRNKHHWQYWILIGDGGEEHCLEMDRTSCIEMLCDWIGAGKAHGMVSPPDDPLLETRNWFLLHQSLIRLHPNSEKYVRSELGLKTDDKSGILIKP
jgi:hypothetical protein